jgi:hypothetical protein
VDFLLAGRTDAAFTGGVNVPMMRERLTLVTHHGAEAARAARAPMSSSISSRLATLRHPSCGYRPRVGPQSSKLTMRVRFPLPAPRSPDTRRALDADGQKESAPMFRMSRFSGEDRRLQHGARGFNSLSALQRTTQNGSRRVGHPGLSDKEPALRSIRR